MLGQTFGRVEVISEQHRTTCGHVLCTYRCRCGNTGTARASDLRRGRVTSCGCALIESNKLQPHAQGKRWKHAAEIARLAKQLADAHSAIDAAIDVAEKYPPAEKARALQILRELKSEVETILA